VSCSHGTELGEEGGVEGRGVGAALLQGAGADGVEPAVAPWELRGRGQERV
jgi:hypothetical protein